MYHYTLSKEPDKEFFDSQCAVLGKRIPGLKRLVTMEEADGSITQAYRKDGLKLSIHNSRRFSGVYINSEFDLTPYFSKVRAMIVNPTLGLGDDEELQDMFRPK